MRAACGAAPSPASACVPVDPLASLSRCFTVRGWAAGGRQCPQSGAQGALRQGRVLLVRRRAGQVAEGEAKAVRPQGRTTILEEEWVELGTMRSGNGDTLDPRMSAKPENPNSVAPARHTHRPGEQKKTAPVNGQLRQDEEGKSGQCPRTWCHKSWTAACRRRKPALCPAPHKMNPGLKTRNHRGSRGEHGQ